LFHQLAGKHTPFHFGVIARIMPLPPAISSLIVGAATIVPFTTTADDDRCSFA